MNPKNNTPLASSLYNFSNNEFGVCPRNTYADSFNLRFYLKHFRSSTVDYVLDETGWDTITQFEDMARRYDIFPCSISPNGFLTCSPPCVDTGCFRVFEFSLHHLRTDVLERVMRFYIGMNLTDYEIQYPEYNSIYLAIPYFSWVSNTYDSTTYYNSSNVNSTNGCDYCDGCYDGKYVNCTTFELSSDSDTDVSEEDVKPSKVSTSLTGWRFKFNTQTNNSYVLYPKDRVQKISNGNVFWGDSCTPATWKLTLKGLNRPLYYSQSCKGWPVSLKLKEALLSQGAREE
jgi:hypothetical protein